ncbi:MAG: hypothetical protein M3R04_07550 [bacterium]|nr:hypothetical protein [bacterium]
MDTTPQPPDPQRERRQLVLGVVAIVLIFAVLITVFTLLIMRSGGRGDYYNDIMERGAQR